MVSFFRYTFLKCCYYCRSIPFKLSVFGTLGVVFLGINPGSTCVLHAYDKLPRELSPEEMVLVRSVDRKLHELKDPQSTLSLMEITEAEINTYFEYHSSELVIDGISGVRFSFFPGLIRGLAVVSFADLRGTQQENGKGLFSSLLLEMMQGKQKVEYSLILKSDQGEARLRIEFIKIEGINLSPILVNFMVNRFLEKKYGFNLVDPIPLPFRIRKVTAEFERLLLERDLVPLEPIAQ